MPWHVTTTKPAEKDLGGIPLPDREAILAALRRAVADPGSADLRKLGGRHGEWRLRVGRWRVILCFDNTFGVISVLRVLPRGSAYKE